MRAPSYLYSSAVRAAVGGQHLVEVAGDLGQHRQQRHEGPRRDAGQRRRARRAARARPPPRGRRGTSAARRTAARSARRPPRAIASSTSPSDTPVRISPPMIRPRNSRSSARRPRGQLRQRAPRAPAASRRRSAAATAREGGADVAQRQRSARPRGGTSRGRPRTPSTRASDVGNGWPVRNATASADLVRARRRAGSRPRAGACRAGRASLPAAGPAPRTPRRASRGHSRGRQRPGADGRHLTRRRPAH